VVVLLLLSPYNQRRLVSHVGFLLSRRSNELLHVFLSVLVLVDIGAAVQWRPLGVLLEQSHGMDEVALVSGEAVVNTRRENKQVVLLEQNAHPVVVLASNVKVSTSTENVTDLLVLVQMLSEERLDLCLVDVAHGLGRDGDLVTVLVFALLRKVVDLVELRKMVIVNANIHKVVDADRLSRVVGEALVAWKTIVEVSSHGCCIVELCNPNGMKIGKEEN
jgi:hypothetical protein